jgi:sugar phosphate isomerase/epimerase
VIVGGDADAAKQEEHFKTMLARTEALKLKFLVFNAGGSWKIPEGYDKEKAWGQLVDFSKRFASAAGQRGMTVLVEPARASDSNQVTTIAEAAKLVDAVGDEHFGMMVDYSLLVMQKDDFAELVKAGPRLKHVWISNPANNRTYAMGDGESDYASFFAALRKMGYRGGLSVHGAPVTTMEVDGPRAIAFLRGKGKALGEQ